MFFSTSLEWQIVHLAYIILISYSMDIVAVILYLFSFGRYVSSALCLIVVTFSEIIETLVKYCKSLNLVVSIHL